jgi:ribose/xylose/arabinose/galactoside ABC-type transport system permease subunit
MNVFVDDAGVPERQLASGGTQPLARRLAFLTDRNFLVPALALIVLVAYFGIRNPAFVSVDSVDNIARQMSFLTVLALAGTFVILIGGIDLSVAANATLAGILVASWIDHYGVVLAIAITVAVGALVGLANGLITIYFRVPSFLVTLGMLSVLNGVSNTISDGGPVSYASGALQTLINESLIPALPNGTLIALVLVAVLSIVAFGTRYGRHLYAVGSNERAAKLVGVRVNRLKLSVFALSGAIAAIAGVIFTGQASTGVPLGADPSLLNSIAAIVVGGTALSGGVGGPHRTLLGALIIVLLGSGMDITAVDPYAQSVVKGLVVIAAVALTIDRRRYGAIR